MSRNYSRAAEGARKKRRRNSILVSVAVAAAIVLLLAFEQIALLYLLATVGVAALLIVVAFADLHGATPTAAAVQPAVPDDSAAIADGLAQAAGVAPTTQVSTGRPRAAKRRQRR
jgi:undecaprenyl pyrophosphate phosphatase UppP